MEPELKDMLPQSVLKEIGINPDFSKEEWFKIFKDSSVLDLIQLSYNQQCNIELMRYANRKRINELFERSGLVGPKPYPEL